MASDDVAPRRIGGGGIEMVLHASAEETSGRFELIEDIRPAGGGPAPHLHREGEEAFFVLAGRFTLTRGTDEIIGGPGTVIVVPRGTRHAYRAEEDGSRILFVVAPAGLAEFLDEIGRLLVSGVPGADAVAQLAGRYDIEPAP